MSAKTTKSIKDLGLEEFENRFLIVRGEEPRRERDEDEDPERADQVASDAVLVAVRTWEPDAEIVKRFFCVGDDEEPIECDTEDDIPKKHIQVSCIKVKGKCIFILPSWFHPNKIVRYIVMITVATKKPCFTFLSRNRCGFMNPSKISWAFPIRFEEESHLIDYFSAGEDEDGHPADCLCLNDYEDYMLYGRMMQTFALETLSFRKPEKRRKDRRSRSPSPARSPRRSAPRRTPNQSKRDASPDKRRSPRKGKQHSRKEADDSNSVSMKLLAALAKQMLSDSASKPHGRGRGRPRNRRGE